MTQEENGIPPPGRTLGYVRVSTPEQELRMQVAALKAQGCPDELIFVNTASGAKAARPGLTQCLATLQASDVLLVWRLDRLGRSMAHLVTLVADLQERGIGFRSLCAGAIDTTTASGELVFTIFSALAQFERRLLQERTRAGLAAGRRWIRRRPGCGWPRRYTKSGRMGFGRFAGLCISRARPCLGIWPCRMASQRATRARATGPLRLFAAGPPPGLPKKERSGSRRPGAPLPHNLAPH